MKRVKSLVFNSFNFETKDNDKGSNYIAGEMSKLNYTDASGFGFSQIQVDDNILSGKILKRTSTYIQDYDVNQKEIVKRQIFLFSDTEFFIDFNFNILYVIGGLAQINYIKSVFRNSFNFNYEASPINLNAAKFYNLLIEKNITFSMEQIIIGKFNYNNGLVGRFSGEIIRQSVGAELVEEYKSDIIKILFKVIVEEEDPLLIQVFQNGSVKLLSDNDEFIYYLSYIKSLIFA